MKIDNELKIKVNNLQSAYAAYKNLHIDFIEHTFIDNDGLYCYSAEKLKKTQDAENKYKAAVKELSRYKRALKNGK